MEVACLIFVLEGAAYFRRTNTYRDGIVVKCTRCGLVCTSTGSSERCVTGCFERLRKLCKLKEANNYYEATNVIPLHRGL
jgi:hypothetical protein